MIRQSVSGLAKRSGALEIRARSDAKPVPTFAVRAHAAVRESIDHIPNGTRRVRVQTVNANPGTKKCGVKLDRRDFRENESVSLGELAAGRTEAAAAAVGRRKRGGGNEFRPDHGGDHQLRDPLAAGD